VALDAFLDGRPRTRAVTTTGEVELPVLYRDATAVLTYFRVAHHRATNLLAGTPLEPVRLGRDTAIAGIAAYDYRDSSVGAYREVGVALAVVPRSVGAPSLPLLHLLRSSAHQDVGWHLLDLPVTSAIADVGGRELWGFPKFVTEIGVDVDAGIRVVVCAPEGEAPIAMLEGRAGPGFPLVATDPVLYTVRAGELLRTLVEARGRMHTALGHGLTLRVGGADAPMARRLCALGLDGARPFAAQLCRHYRAVLHAAVPFHASAERAA
jgi:hypothetical protein